MTVCLSMLLSLTGLSPLAPGEYFAIQVIDAQSRRGVPLVELTTDNRIRHYTDSNGLVAFHEPGLMDRRVFFHVKSHGYEFPADGFGYRGRSLEVKPGGEVVLEIKRINIAERLYRLTGQGIYTDTVLLGRKPPTANPVINGLVMGQDSVQNAIYQGKLYWFWGDTGKPEYPLGNFQMTGATSRLPADGGLDPDVGVNLDYFVGESGFVKKMAPMEGNNPIWLDGPVILTGADGRERMYAHYARITPPMSTESRGLMVYNDDKQEFELVTKFDLSAPVLPAGHALKVPADGSGYVYYPNPFPLVRVRADAKTLADASQYEAYTCLKDGSRFDDPRIDRAEDGTVRYRWRRNTPMIGSKEQADLLKAGLLKPGEEPIHLQDVETGKTITPHSGSVFWNPWRKRWITIRSEIMGTSLLGEVWYAEADDLVGPWVYARKIITHEQYSFYNPRQHPEFDKENGRLIYFEGTYTHSFSGNPDQTPRYDYNQIMYKLDLSDPRLALPVPVYEETQTGRLTLGALSPEEEPGRPIAFFAPDRSGIATLAVYESKLKDGSTALKVAASQEAIPSNATALFYVLPADMKDPPATTAVLYEFVSKTSQMRRYSTDEAGPGADWIRSEKPICRVWRCPVRQR